MKNTRLVPRAKVSADGRGVVSHAGVCLLREKAQATGSVSGVNDALMDTYSCNPPWPGSGVRKSSGHGPPIGKFQKYRRHPFG